MAITLSAKVTNLLNSLNEDLAKFTLKAQEMVNTPGKKYFATTLNKTTYYMSYRKLPGGDWEVYDYDLGKPAG